MPEGRTQLRSEQAYWPRRRTEPGQTSARGDSYRTELVAKSRLGARTRTIHMTQKPEPGLRVEQAEPNLITNCDTLWPAERNLVKALQFLTARILIQFIIF